MNFKFEIKPVKIDPTPFKEAAATANQANESGEKLACATKLTCYKNMTVNGQSLRGDELRGAYTLARKMAGKGWLTEEDKKWCEENSISI